MSSDILQDDFIMDADEEDALLENRHSIFLDRDGEKVDRYNFDDDEEEDILDIGVTEDLSLIESDQLLDYTATIDKSSQRVVEKKDLKISFSKQANQSNVVNTVSSSGGASEASVAENVPSSTSGVEEASEGDKNESRFKGAKKIVISSSQSAGPVAKQIFTKELRNRREQSSNIRKRLGGQVRQGNMQMRQGHPRMRHPHPRFMSPHQGGERMMGPRQFRPPGPHFGGGPPRQIGPPPPRPAGPPPHQQRSQGPFPRKILINPHFHQNNQNKNQQWGGQNPPPQRFHQPALQAQAWQTPPPQNQPPQQFSPQFQPPLQSQPPRFRHAVPPMEYDQRKEHYDRYPPQDPVLQQSPVITPEPQSPDLYYQQPNYRPDYDTYQEPPSQSMPPPQHPSGPPQAPAYQQQGYYQSYSDTRPPPQQHRMEPVTPSYEIQPQSHMNPYEAPRQPQQPPVMGPPDIEMIHPEQPYSQHPSPIQNYPPPQAQYATEALNQYAPRPYEDPNQFNIPRQPPPNQFQQPPPNPAFRPDFNRTQAPPRLAPDGNQYAPPESNQYAYGQGPPRSDPYDRPSMNQLGGPSTSGFVLEQRQPPNQFSQPSSQGFSQPDIAPTAQFSPRGNIKSRLGARVPVSPVQGQQHQLSQQMSSPPYGGSKNMKRNLNPVHPGHSPPKQPRYDQPTARKVPSRNLQEVQTVSNLPDTTTFSDRDTVIEGDDENEEMREYRKKIEAQKQFREKIFQIKEARRKQAVLQQGRAGAKETSNPTSSAATNAPGPSRSVQPIATIVNHGGAGKRPMSGGVRKTGGAQPNTALAKRAARFGVQRPGVPREIVDQSKVEGQRSIILPDTTQGQQSSQTGSLEPNLTSKTAGMQPRTLDERFSSLKSGVLVQPKEERFITSSNRTVLPAGGPQLDPNASSVVIVDNLSASTKAQQLVDIASQCGKLAELNLKQSQKQAILKFKTAAGAAEFFKKYQRKMIDLSMISLSMGPPAKS